MANLCREFNIELINHHRALADARAAAALLNLVNAKRLKNAPQMGEKSAKISQ
ncbi:MAG TPA: hypothetical protein VLZ84_12965 [Asticcacaulis sp.]|nr:hypothetical protein [Asticcacaulis sp.]